jgi:predicted dehydrogenase
VNDVRFALMGCGRISGKHAEALTGKVAGARLVAVCDVRPERARAVGERCGVPFYADLEELAAREQVDVVNVLTPSGLHAAHAVQVARLKKHVVVEKPMSLTLDDADRMIRECDLNNVRLFVVKQNRYNPPVQLLKQAMDAGRFGTLVLGTVRVRWCRRQEYYDQDSWRGTWALDGGVFTNQASHHVDLLEWMMGDVDSVFAKASTRLVQIETEDTGAAILKFRNGALGVIEATTATRPRDLEGSISILGERGSVEIGGFAVNQMKVWQFQDQTPEDDRVLAAVAAPIANVYGHGHVAFLQDVVSCIRTKQKALVDGLEGRRSLELINAIYESAETGREISLRFSPQKCRLGQGPHQQ